MSAPHINCRLEFVDQAAPSPAHFADIVERLGLKTTSNQEPRMANTADRNPYAQSDYRTETSVHDFKLLSDRPFNPIADGQRAYPGFTISRLEAMLRDEFARGYHTGEDAQKKRTDEVLLPKARLEAWDEGHHTGVMHGRSELLTQIAERHEEEVKQQTNAIAILLTDKKATKRQLHDALDETRELLMRLVHSHHGGFEPTTEPPA